MYTDPRTKEDFVNRLLSYDFNGDFTDLGEEAAVVTRETAYCFTVKFPHTSQKYEIAVSKPRKAPPVKAAKAPPQARRPRLVARFN